MNGLRPPLKAPPVLVIATRASPVITKVVMGTGLPVEAVFFTGAVSAAMSLGCLMMLEREFNPISFRVS